MSEINDPKIEQKLLEIFGKKTQQPWDEPRKTKDPKVYEKLKEALKDTFESLSDRERKVLELRFGIVDGHSRTLEEVGQQFKVTRERIRQIEANITK